MIPIIFPNLTMPDGLSKSEVNSHKKASYSLYESPGLSPQNLGKTPPCVSSYAEAAPELNGPSDAVIAAAAVVSLGIYQYCLEIATTSM